MKSLLAELDACFDDAEGGICIVGANWIESTLTLTLSITFHADRQEELWEIACEGVAEESLHSEWAVGLSVSEHSPLLKPFLEPDVPLMFSENGLDPEALFGIVCSCCIEVMGRPESISRFINGEPTARGICSRAYGLLGRFPETLAARIMDACQGRQIRLNILPGFRPMRWDGSARVAYKRLQVLEIGSSYIVADQFCTRRL